MSRRKMQKKYNYFKKIDSANVPKDLFFFLLVFLKGKDMNLKFESLFIFRFFVKINRIFFIGS